MEKVSSGSVTQPQAKTTAKKTTKGEPVTAAPATVEELQKQVSELTAKLNAIPQDLEERINYFNHKKDLIHKLSRLEENAENLNHYLNKVLEIVAVNDFETEDFILTIETGTKYSRNQIFALQNPSLIAEVLHFLLGKIKVKIEIFKMEIEA